MYARPIQIGNMMSSLRTAGQARVHRTRRRAESAWCTIPHTACLQHCMLTSAAERPCPSLAGALDFTCAFLQLLLSGLGTPRTVG